MIRVDLYVLEDAEGREQKGVFSSLERAQEIAGCLGLRVVALHFEYTETDTDPEGRLASSEIVKDFTPQGRWESGRS